MAISTPHFARPDFSQYVVHFTKNGVPLSNDDETDKELKGIANMSAHERLISILSTKQIRSTRMPWTNRPAICFTECTWASLLDHARRYSRFGIGFTKAYLFSRGGGPAIYLTSHEREWRVPHDLNFEHSDIAFVIIASYEDMAKAPKELKDAIGRDNWLIMDNYAKKR